MFFKNTSRRIIPLPYFWYFWPVTLIALIGFFDSIYLSISHHRNYVDMGHQSFCAISRALNCDTVSQSPYSIFLNVPVPVWGILGYGFFLFLLVFALYERAEKKRVWTLLMIVSLVFSIYSTILAFISSFYIHSYCLMCILSYAVNLALLFYAWIIRKRFMCEPVITAVRKDILYLLTFPKTVISVTSIFTASALVMILLFPPYWLIDPPELSQNIPAGVTEEGNPWIGAAEDPELVITEFTDYLCTQCRIKHFFLRQIVGENPEKIRLIHRHFPMDHKYNPIVRQPYHEGSGVLALFSIYARTQNNFWEANDLFFQLDKSIRLVNSKNIAEMLDLDHRGLANSLKNQNILYHLQKDIQKGLELGLTGTPGYVINNEVYQGYIPDHLLKKGLE